MASAGSCALPVMAAGGSAERGRARADTRGPGRARRGRQRRKPPGHCTKGCPDSGHLETASAQPAEEEPAAARSREPSLGSSSKAAGRRPSKKLKCEINSLVKPELEGPACESENLAALREAPKTSDGNGCAGDPGDHNIIQQKKGEDIPDTNEGKKEHNVSPEPHAVKSSGAASKMISDEHLHVCSEEERSCGSLFSDGSGLEDADVPRRPMELDSSALLNDDSNQPMPLARFFGDVALLQDLPAAALPSTMLSRREFRKLHFIAKEEEEEEEEDAV